MLNVIVFRNFFEVETFFILLETKPKKKVSDKKEIKEKKKLRFIF